MGVTDGMVSGQDGLRRLLEAIGGRKACCRRLFFCWRFDIVTGITWSYYKFI